MSIWQWILRKIGKRPKPSNGHRIFQASDSLQVLVSSIAKREGLPEDEFTSDLVAAGLVQYLGKSDIAPKWQSLTKREKEVARLVGQGLSNRQIAGQLSVSTHTINSHIQNIMRKFGVSEKGELRHILALINFPP